MINYVMHNFREIKPLLFVHFFFFMINRYYFNIDAQYLFTVRFSRN